MAESADRGVALLSIHPRHAESIFSGRKKVEFRRVAFKRDLGHVIVYATAPISKVVGWFTVAAVDHEAPTTLWRRYSDVAGISSTEFDAYFAGTDTGVAIRVGDTTRLRTPIPLPSLERAASPPQSYCYLGQDALVRLANLHETLPEGERGASRRPQTRRSPSGLMSAMYRLLRALRLVSTETEREAASARS